MDCIVRMGTHKRANQSKARQIETERVHSKSHHSTICSTTLPFGSKDHQYGRTAIVQYDTLSDDIILYNRSLSPLTFTYKIDTSFINVHDIWLAKEVVKSECAV
jgi:hypothetical protein